MRFSQIQAVGDTLYAIDDRGSLWRHDDPGGDLGLNDEQAEQKFIEGWQEVPHPDDVPPPPPKPEPVRANVARKRRRGSRST